MIEAPSTSDVGQRALTRAQTGGSEGPGKRVLILSAGAGSGHNVAAGVLESHARAQQDVEAVQTLDVLELTSDLYRGLYDDAYFRLVNAVPWMVGWSYDVRDTPFRNRDPLWLLDQLNTTEVAKAIQSYQPDIVLSTHFLPARLVSLLRTRGQIHSTLFIITTDYDFQGLWLSTPFNGLDSAEKRFADLDAIVPKHVPGHGRRAEVARPRTARPRSGTHRANCLQPPTIRNTELLRCRSTGWRTHMPTV